MAKETVKVILSQTNHKPYEILKRTPEGGYHPQGSKYTLKGLINYIVNAIEGVEFDKEATERYSKELEEYEKSQKAKKEEWERAQRDRKEGKLELTLNIQNLQAAALIETIRADNEERR